MKFKYITMTVCTAALMAGCSQVESGADAAKSAANDTVSNAGTAVAQKVKGEGHGSGTKGDKRSLPGADISTAPAGTYKSEAGHAYIAFSYLHQGYSKPILRWGEFESTIELDPETPENSTLSVSIPVDSIDSGVDEFDEYLLAPDFFDEANHPVITFKSTDLQIEQVGKGQLIGELTMKGITKPLKLKAKLNKVGEHFRSKAPMFGISAQGRLKRSDWDLGKFAPSVGDDVNIKIEVEYILEP